MLIVAGQRRTLETAIRNIVQEFGEQVLKDLQGIRSVADLSAKVKDLRQQVETLEIEEARKDEERERKDREIEHKIGLERKRQEFEVQAAKREAILTVKEENLAADRKRFEDQMAFHEKRFTEEVGYLKDMIGTLAERLPNVNMEVQHGTRKSR